jgi:hypothetical protein
MHAQLLSMGFVRLPDGTYYNYEICLKVSVIDDKQVLVHTFDGDIPATLKELEDAITSDGFGEI